MFLATAGEAAQLVTVDAGVVALVEGGSRRGWVVDAADAARAPSSEPPHDATVIATTARSAATTSAREVGFLEDNTDIVGFFMPTLDDSRMKLSSSARQSSMIRDGRVTGVTGVTRRAPTSR